MSMKFSVYVGPYLIVSKHYEFDWHAWGAIVCNGRGIEGFHEKDWFLIPNCRPARVKRQMQFDQFRDFKITSISPATIVQEMTAFSRLTSDLVQWCNDREIELHQAWGVVPCCLYARCRRGSA